MRRGLLALPGILEANVVWQAGRAEVTYDPAVVTPAQILEAPIFTQEVGSRFVRHRYQASLAS